MWTQFEKILLSAPVEGTPAPAPAPSQDSPSPTPEVAPAAPSLLGSEPAAPAEAEKPAEPATETLPALDLAALKLPENFVIPEDVGKEFTELAGKHGLKTEAAQELVNVYAAQLQKQMNASAELYERMNTEWVDQIRADKEVGGEKLDGNLAKIGKLLGDSKFVDPGFKEALNLTGAGNHPAVFRTMLKIAEALSEGAPVGGTPSAQSRPGSIAEAMYPNYPKG
jgi:hypothetical protein